MQNNAKELREVWDKVAEESGCFTLECAAACLLAEGLGDKSFALLRTTYKFGTAQQVYYKLRNIVNCVIVEGM